MLLEASALAYTEGSEGARHNGGTDKDKRCIQNFLNSRSSLMENALSERFNLWSKLINREFCGSLIREVLLLSLAENRLQSGKEQRWKKNLKPTRHTWDLMRRENRMVELIESHFLWINIAIAHYATISLMSHNATLAGFWRRVVMNKRMKTSSLVGSTGREEIGSASSQEVFSGQMLLTIKSLLI